MAACGVQTMNSASECSEKLFPTLLSSSPCVWCFKVAFVLNPRAFGRRARKQESFPLEKYQLKLEGASGFFWRAQAPNGPQQLSNERHLYQVLSPLLEQHYNVAVLTSDYAKMASLCSPALLPSVRSARCKDQDKILLLLLAWQT